MSLEIIGIRDRHSGAQARILPGLGFNCFSFEVNDAGQKLETLWSHPELLGGAAKPSGSGIPIMFPFAGRIRGAQFTYEGKRYELTPADGLGNAIHGFVLNRAWRVLRREENLVAGVFQASVDEPALLSKWPADFRITCEYQLQGNTLLSEFLIQNPDTKPLPFGFGTHGYFRIPLGGSSANDCVVTVPVSSNWVLDNLLPTGKQDAPPQVAQIARGMPAGDMHLDNVFGGVQFENHRALASVVDPQSKHRMTLSFDDQFTSCVVFNPPHREAVCIEPYTTLPDAFALREQGVDPHLRVLPPGGAFRTRIEMKFE
jgi:aldose 1-epimerase